MKKKIEPLSCLCEGGMHLCFDGNRGGYWLECQDRKCVVTPYTEIFKTRHGAVHAWNHWVSKGALDICDLLQKVELLPCLCGRKPRAAVTCFKTTFSVECCNFRCVIQPNTKGYVRKADAIRAWNCWVTTGVKRLNKILEETNK